MKTNIWSYHRTITNSLYVWSALSIVIGVLMLFAGTFWQGVGSMFIGWGAIDAAIAFFGSRSARKRQAATPPGSITAEAAEAQNLRRSLLVNTRLDVLYVVTGLLLALTRPEPFWQGAGWGMVVQGGFLFLFDLYHTLRCPKP